MNNINAENIILYPQYIDGSQGKLFTLFHPPADPEQATFLFLPSFAEELNRCRVMVAMQARQMAAQGYGCLILDYYGTGDSEGDFSETHWQQWLLDVETARNWLQAKGFENIALWGLRVGALLAVHEAIRHPDVYQRVLLWQPVLDGKQYLTQFLRLRIAMLMDRGLQKETTQEMRETLKTGRSVEVAGYELTARLVNELDRQKMADYLVSNEMPPVDWFEVTINDDAVLPLSSQKVLALWAEKSVSHRVHTYQGPFFWQLHERELTPELLTKTNQVLSEQLIIT